MNSIIQPLYLLDALLMIKSAYHETITGTVLEIIIIWGGERERGKVAYIIYKHITPI